MRQRWWIAVVAVVGVVLAFLLFPRPDTGAALPVAEGRSANRPPPGQAFGDPPARADGQEEDRSHIRTGIKPGQEELVAKRNRPEVVYASKLVTPFSSIRYMLIKEGSEPAKALADEIGTTMSALRDMRLDPDSITWPDLQTKTDATIASIRASSFANDEQVVRSLQKYDEFVAEYQTAKQAEGSASPVAPTANPPGAPVAPADQEKEP